MAQGDTKTQPVPTCKVTIIRKDGKREEVGTFEATVTEIPEGNK